MTKNANFSHGGDFFRRFVHLLGRFGAQRRAKKQRTGAVVVFVGWFFCVIKNQNAKHFKIGSVAVRKIESGQVRISVVGLFLRLGVSNKPQKTSKNDLRRGSVPRGVSRIRFDFFQIRVQKYGGETKFHEIASFYWARVDFLIKSKVGGFFLKKIYNIFYLFYTNLRRRTFRRGYSEKVSMFFQHFTNIPEVVPKKSPWVMQSISAGSRGYSGWKFV